MVFSPYKYFGRHWPRQKFTGMIRMDLCCLSVASLKSVSEQDILVKNIYDSEIFLFDTFSLCQRKSIYHCILIVAIISCTKMK